MSSNDNIVRAKIELEDGREISFFYELNIHQKVADHHTFELRCPLNAMESDSEPLINHSKDLFGKLIKVGFASGSDQHPAEYFFKGIITNLSVDKYQGIGGDLLISGYSPTILLEEGRKYGTFDGKTISENVRQVMQDIPSNLLEANSDPDTDSNVGYRVQYKESSFHYLLRLAHAYNQWLYFDGTKLYFGKRKEGDPLELHFGSDVTSMKLEYKLAHSHFQVINYNPQSDQVLTSDSANAHGSRLDDLSDLLQSKSESTFTKTKQISLAFHPEQQSDMDDVAVRLKNRLGSEYLMMTGRCNNPHIKIGSLIRITGPNRANPSNNDDYGKYRVVALEQTVDGGGSYSSSFEAISSEAPTPPYGIEPQFMPVEDEFATVKDNKDPEQLGRVRVQHTWQTGEEMTHWLDASQVYAGDKRGFYFVPDIGDIVMLGYINGNPSYPYVKGSIYRKDHKSEMYDDDNKIKGIAMSENLWMNYAKDATVNGNPTDVVAISTHEEGDHANYVLVAKDGEIGVQIRSKHHTIKIKGDQIEIESTGDMTIKSGGALDVTSSGKLTLDAGSNDAEIKGMNVKLTATQKVSAAGLQAEVNGSTTTKITGGAEVEVTAAIIKLN